MRRRLTAPLVEIVTVTTSMRVRALPRPSCSAEYRNYWTLLGALAPQIRAHGSQPR